MLRLPREVFFLFLLAISIAPIFLFGLFYPDEGYILHTASRLINGEVMYRDFNFIYTPLSAWIPAGFFLLFGKSVLVGRFAAYVMALISIFALFFTLSQYTKKLIWILISTVVFISWGLFHINFIWPSMIAITCSLVACFFYAKSDRNIRFLIGVGIFSAFALLSKQNLGLAITLVFLLIIFFENWVLGKKKILLSSLYYLSGLMGVAFLFFMQLLLQGSVISFLQNNYLNLFQKIIIEGSITTPFVYGDGIYSWVKLFFYLSPALLCIPAITVAVKHKSSSFFLPVVCAAIFLAGIRPVTDYVHISPLFSLVCLPLFVLTLFLRKRVYLIFLLFYSVIVIGVGFYYPLFLYYYRWQEPVIKQTYFVNQKHTLIYTERRYASEISELTSYINSISEQNSYIFINYYAPMVYFLLDRRNPTRYDYVSGGGLSSLEHEDIVRTLEEKKVQVVITHAIVQNDTGSVYRYIKDNFIRKRKIGDLIFWQRKKI